MVKSPELRRPPVRCRVTVSGLYGRSVVRSSFTTVDVKRSDGVIGRYVLIGIVYSLLEIGPRQRSRIFIQIVAVPENIVPYSSILYRLSIYSGIFWPA